MEPKRKWNQSKIRKKVGELANVEINDFWKCFKDGVIKA